MTPTWYSEESTSVLEALHTRAAGLTAEEAEAERVRVGKNALPEAKTASWFSIFFGQFQSPLIYILLVACVAIFFLGEKVDAGIIFAVLLFNAIVGTVQEGRAQNTLRALKHYVETTATVLRDGRALTISDASVVPGDILVLTEGGKIAADARVLVANTLKLDEASLTGESDPVNKVAEALTSKDLSLGEQHNMVFKGTSVLVGSGRAVVVATGVHTVIGSIARDIATIDTEIPLKKSVRYLSRIIIGMVVLISVGLVILGLIKGDEVPVIIATVISLAVSVIPEGLPIVITLVLASGVRRMSKRNALVKKLQAVEALGQARIIAVDKTGTITKNELVIREVWIDGEIFSIEGVGYEPVGTVSFDGAVVDAANHPELLHLGKYAALSASAEVSYSISEKRWQVTGDPTEAAIRVFGEKMGFKKDDLLRESPVVSELAFAYDRNYHAVACESRGQEFLVVSGAPEAILALCAHTYVNGERVLIREAERNAIEAALVAMSARGLRVVMLAEQEKFHGPLTSDVVHSLTFSGLLGMQDILRVDVARSVARAHEAGMRVVMITGDYQLTGLAIAKEASIWRTGDEVLTGGEIDAMSDAELKVRVAKVTVFARVTPEHKLRIITAYKARGEIIAMTGDGVNDAPSLVAADLGIAMGVTGTEVAKEAADIVLLDDHFDSIIAAVEEGRNIYTTIRKVLVYLFSTSLGEVWVITFALILNFPLPLLAAQIIWLNFVTDGFLDVSLAMEPKEDGLLRGTFVRPNKYIVDGSMIVRMITMAIPMTIGTLLLFHHYALTDLTKAWTISLTTLAIFQWFNAWNARSDSQSLFRTSFFSNRYLVAATLLVIVLQVLAVYLPVLQDLLHTVPLTAQDWVLVAGVATSIIWVEELRKYFVRRLRTHKAHALVSAQV